MWGRLILYGTIRANGSIAAGAMPTQWSAAVPEQSSVHGKKHTAGYTNPRRRSSIGTNPKSPITYFYLYIVKSLDFRGEESVDKKKSSLSIASILQNLHRPVPIPGMENENVPDPLAQDILKAGASFLDSVSLYLTQYMGINSLTPLKDAYGSDCVVLKADDKVVRLGLSRPTAKPEAIHVLQPLATRKIGLIYVQISTGLDTSGITEADVRKVEDDLASQGYEWDDAGTGNLGRDGKGELWIIDGTVKKKGDLGN